VYFSTWQENGKPHFAELTISPKPTNSKVFSLFWNGTVCDFEGEGMLCDDILIGDYHSVKKNNECVSLRRAGRISICTLSRMTVASAN
jgi:hypothetical protein